MPKKIFNELETVTSHSVSDFLLDEEASIPKGRLLSIGSLMVVLACVLGIQDAFAGHRSHRSHSSHSSGRYNHYSHESHRSHSSHSSSSHSSHSSSRHASHSSSYDYHSNAAPSPALPDTLEAPQTLPDTLPIE